MGEKAMCVCVCVGGGGLSMRATGAQLECVPHLLCNHRQHLQVDAVELIKARPGARGGEALEELALCPKTRTVAQSDICEIQKFKQPHSSARVRIRLRHDS